MANQTITGLNTLVTPSTHALLWVYDPDATPADRNLSLPNLLTFISTRLLAAPPFYVIDSISGSKTYGAFDRDTRIIESASGTIDITAGATAAGLQVVITNKYAAGITVNTKTGSASVAMGLGSLKLEWDGTQWSKVGGNSFLVKFTSGTDATWKTPWAGAYKITVVAGGGGGGGGPSTCGGAGGGGGGGAQSVANEAAGTTFTYTVGAAGAGGSGPSGNGGDGGVSYLLDGLGLALSGTGGIGGKNGTSPPAAQGEGGVGNGGQLNFGGQGGGASGDISTSNTWGGTGGCSILGQGGKGGIGSHPCTPGLGYGGGGAGGVNSIGSPGSLGAVVIEF